MSNRSAFYVEYVSIPLCRSAFGYRSYLKCFNVTTANYPPRKTSSRSAFNVEQVSILCRIREHSIVQVSIRIPIISLCRSAFDHTSSVSMLLPPITLLGKHQAGQHLTSNRSAFHIPLRQRFAVQMQRSIRSLSLSLLSPSLSLSLSLSLIIIYMHICAWQSADGHVTSTTVAWPFSNFFQNFPKSLETSKKRCLTVGRRSRDLRPLSRDRLATFFKKNSNCLKRRKIVVWQSADSRVTSDHCRVTVQRLFSKFSQIARNVQKTLFDSRPTVAWPPTTVAWQFSDFFQKISISLETSKNVIWQLPDGRVTTEYCRLTVQRLFSKFFQIASNVQERCLTVGRRSRDLRSLSRDSGYFLPCLFRTAFAYASVCCLSRCKHTFVKRYF